MDTNPYAPPKAAVADRGRRDTRPFEIAVLTGAAVWGFLSNTAPFFVPGYVAAEISNARFLGIPPAVALASEVLLALFWAAISVGLWWRRPRGWWCAAFLYQASILRYGFMLPTEMRFGVQGGRVILHIATLIVFVVQLLVLYTINARTWTGVSGSPLRRLVLLPFLAAISFTVLVSVLQDVLRAG